MYEFLGCFLHGQTCLHFRDVTNLAKGTLDERFEQAMARLQRITPAGYIVDVVWECQFDKDILPHHQELKQHPIFQHTPLNTRDALYGDRTEAMGLHYAIREGETIQYCDIMFLYPFICKYSKFPIGHTKIDVGDASRDKHAMLYKEDLIKCTVLSSKRLYHPVLPFRCNNKLLFCLCRTCGLESNFGRMRRRIGTRKVSNGNVGPCRDSVGHSEGLQGPRYY